jgi:hypothetical protein
MLLITGPLLRNVQNRQWMIIKDEHQKSAEPDGLDVWFGRGYSKIL